MLPAVTAADRLPDASDVRLRSGTVARLAGIPVATLRIWERRYRVVAAPKSAGGQRLYSSHDVQRLRLLRTLTTQGHAIGTIAMLPLTVLQALSDGTASGGGLEMPPQHRDVPLDGIVAVGSGLADRLRDAGTPASRCFDSVLLAAQALTVVPPEPRSDPTADPAHSSAHPIGRPRVLAVQMATLQPTGSQAVLNLAARLPGTRTVVLYAFGAEALVDDLRRAGIQVQREPVGAHDLNRLVTAAARLPSAAAHAAVRPAAAARRYSDAALRRLAAVQSSVACECQRHVAELVLLLSGFERYSAECGVDSPPAAGLHLELNRLAGAARSLLEDALDRVIQDEHLSPSGFVPAPGALAPAAAVDAGQQAG